MNNTILASQGMIQKSSVGSPDVIMARRITGAESDIADRIMRDPRVIEEGLRITAREKQTRSVHTKRLYAESVQW